MMEWSSPSFGEGMALAEAVDERADAGDRARRERRFHDARACHAPEDTPSHPHFSNTLSEIQRWAGVKDGRYESPLQKLVAAVYRPRWIDLWRDPFRGWALI